MRGLTAIFNLVFIIAEDEYLDEGMSALFMGALSNYSEDITIPSYDISIPTGCGNNIINFRIDTGADVSAISVEELEKFGLAHKDIKPTNKKLIGPGSERLKCIGYIQAKSTWGQYSLEELLYVCKDLKRALLGKPAIRNLNILHMEKPKTVTCGTVENNEDIAEVEINDPIVQKYPEVFEGLGKMKGDPIHIKLKEGTVPYQISTPRHIAILLRTKVIKELNRMYKKYGVIRNVDKPTAWCHPIVVVLKPNGEVRICIDLTKLNNGIERELYQLESVEETMARLGDECVYMSKVDANAGYWKLPLDEESQLLTTFITPIGRFCCTTGPFGLSSMQEIFNKRMDTIIEGLEGVAKSTDDFLIYAKTEEEHNQRLEKLLDKLKEYNVTLNKEKCVFKKT